VKNRRGRPLRRSAPSPWVRIPATIVAYVVLVPLTFILRIFGWWPRVLGKFGGRFSSSFGAYRPGPHDVVVASFFKSGTNWTMQMAQQIAHRGDAEFDHIHDVVPWPELGDDARYAVDVHDMTAISDSPTGLRAIKTHLPLGNVPYVASAKYVCVVRDPKDVLVSSYFFIKRVALGPMMPTLAQWKALTLSANDPFGSWAEHLDSFWRSRDLDNVLFLQYEQMKSDPSGTIAALADFMGVELSPAEHARVLERSSFEYMKEISHKFDPIGVGLPWARASGSMMRRGAAGQSAEYLSKPDRDEIDKHYRLTLEALGSRFPYDETYSADPKT